MRLWPTSLPNYAWPPELTGRRNAPRRWVLAILFHAAHMIGRLVGLKDRDQRRVLIIRTDGVGDSLLSEPLLRSLARSMPRYGIHLWAPQLTCEMLFHCPAVDQLMSIPRGFRNGNLEYFGSARWRMKLGFALGRWTFSKAIYPAQSPEPLGNWLLESARASQRWLNSGDTINQFEQQRREAHAVATRLLERLPGNAHELTANQHLAYQWEDQTPLGMPIVHLTDRIQKRAKAQVSAWSLEMRRVNGREMIGVVPSASMAINRYPDERWISALRKLWMQRRAVPVLLGGPEDQPAITRLAGLLKSAQVPCLRLFVRSSILEMAALVEEMDGVISVDTGLAHLAIALEVPTVVLVGGGNPGRFFPWPAAAHHVALNVTTPCAGCNNRCNQPEAICITQIAPDEIASAYSRLKTRSVAVQLFVSNPPVYQKAG